MKMDRIVASGVVFGALLFGALAAIAQQSDATNQSGQTSQTNQSGQDNQPNRLDNSQSGTADTSTGDTGNRKDLSRLDGKTTEGSVRASQLIGTNLKNSSGEGVGEIKDLVIDSSGKVRYAAVTYGGFLGVGSKLFAVPFEAFKVRRHADNRSDRGNYQLTLDVTKQQLDGAQSFDNDHWPNFADTKFTQELDRRYNVSRNSSTQTESQSTR